MHRNRFVTALAITGVSVPHYWLGTGIDLLHVPYRGSGPMLTDLLGGQVQMTFDTLLASLEHIRAGKLRALAVTSAARSAELSEHRLPVWALRIFRQIA